MRDAIIDGSDTILHQISSLKFSTPTVPVPLHDSKKHKTQRLKNKR